MTVYVQDADLTLHLGDVRDVLPTLEAESVDCVATSPPFYALRDYGTGEWEGGDPGCDHSRQAGGLGKGTIAGTQQADERGTLSYRDVCGKCGARRVDRQIGLEATPDEWAAELVAVFRECRRVLRPHGCMLIEIGDSYENKNLVGQPFRLAFALQADSWFWRGCYVWHKLNCMPESARDRCTVAHSYVLHFSKNARYYWDGDAIAEPAAWERWGDQTTPKHNGTDTASGWMAEKTVAELPVNGSKNARSVWQIPTRGFPGAHFATWPEELAKRIILAGCPEGGTVLDPFGGAGTTALVARRLGRRSVLVELNEEYAEMAARRILKRQSKPLPADFKPARDGTLNLLAEEAAS